MSAKLVTSRQGQSVVDMANDKGVSREEFQRALDNGNIAKFLDSIRMVPLKGCRIFTANLLVEGVEKEIVLLRNWENSWDDVIAWSQRVGLKTTTLKQVSSIGEQNLGLDVKLYDLVGYGPVQIMATKEALWCNVGVQCGIRSSPHFAQTAGWRKMFESTLGDGTVWLVFCK